MLNTLLIDDIIKRALVEDIGTGDVTTVSTVPPSHTTGARFVAKEDGIICGLQIAARVFKMLDADIEFYPLVKDGDKVVKGDMIATVSGNTRSILTAERTALNYLQRLSAIATKTSYYVKLLEGTSARITDTRKTTPGLRVLEKYAVAVGGGSNHRFGLSDGVLIKDNHIAAAGSISNAVNAARKNVPHMVKIEVETETLDEVKEALNVGVDVIMLDNMSIDEMREAVLLINSRAMVEASGNMDERNLKDVAACGVDIISMGALTHTVKAMDISLKFDK